MAYNRYQQYSDAVILDFSVFLLLLIESLIHVFTFRKHFTRVYNNIYIMVFLGLNIIVDIMGISHFQPGSANTSTIPEDKLSSFGLVIMGFHQLMNLLYMHSRYRNLEIRVRRILRIREERREQYENDNNLDYEEPEVSAKQKAMKILSDYYNTIPEDEREIRQDFEFCMITLKSLT